ncbi:uncharacterized protein LOC130664879 [Microplitis mediator]|uniref:uncharacterized protein LOC130664879 n=1 Tax=Microplitis mediator TaxID=375433 RepID=UPI00255635E4|nr:uncharacterized protein LOC130664879 [Microplitis mediator]
MSQLLGLCFANKSNPIIMSVDLVDSIDQYLSSAIKAPITVINHKFKSKNIIPYHPSHPTYVISADLTDELETLLHEFKSSPAWNIVSHFFVVGTDKKSCQDNAAKVLQLLWRSDLLSSFYLCPETSNDTTIYTFNPFTNYAPDPWVQVEITDKPDSRWTLFKQLFVKDPKICHILQFDKTKILDGYSVKTLSDGGEIEFFKKSIVPSLNLTYSDRYYNKSITTLSNIYYALNNNISDVGVITAPLDSINYTLSDIIFLNFELSLLIATQKRSVINPFSELNFIFNVNTVIVMVIIFLLIIVIIGLNNRYRFGAAFLDVYLMLLNMGILLPLNRLAMRIIFFFAFFYIFMVSPFLQGELFAALAKPKYHNIESLTDLYQYKYHVHYFRALDNDIKNEGLWTTDSDMQYLHSDDDPFSWDCLELASKDETVACIYPADFILNYAFRYGLHVSNKLLFPTSCIYNARKHWALKSRVDQKVLHFIEAGVINRYERLAVNNLLKKMKAIDKIKKSNQSEIIDGDDLMYAFVLMGHLLLLAIVIFGIERLNRIIRPPRQLERENEELQEEIVFINEDRVVLD